MSTDFFFRTPTYICMRALELYLTIDPTQRTTRQVLIESKCGRILPDWMRFIKGCVPALHFARLSFSLSTTVVADADAAIRASNPIDRLTPLTDPQTSTKPMTTKISVVDSEDLPLSISREKAQDTALLKRIERVLVRKVLFWGVWDYYWAEEGEIRWTNRWRERAIEYQLLRTAVGT